LHRITEHVAQLIEAEKPAGVDLIRDYDPSLRVDHRRSNQMIQAFLNIARKRDAGTRRAGRFDLPHARADECHDGGERHRLVLSAEVEDNGPGIPDELRDTIFYPLVTGRATGTGLGLTIAQDLVSRNGGLIEFESQPGGRCSSCGCQCRTEGDTDATPGLSVWIVDDDESVRWVLEQALKQAHMIPRASSLATNLRCARARSTGRADH